MKQAIKVSSLFFRNQPKYKLYLAFGGFTIGIVSFLFCLQLMINVAQIIQKNDTEKGSKYLQVSKQIGYGNTLGLSSVDFSKKEVALIRQQSFIDGVAEVKANAFEVAIKGNSFLPFYSELFLQSVPNSFLDVDTSGFFWREGQDEVPVIVSNHFFNLYNHGFAPSQGLPSLPKSALKQKSFLLILKGKDQVRQVRCRIYGFSDRINSILVPEEFLFWGNKELASQKQVEINMLILKVKDVADPHLKTYLDNNGYSVNKEQLSADQAGQILNILSGIFLLFAFIIMLMSLFQILTYSSLVIAENKSKLEVLILLGYSRIELSKALFGTYLKQLGLVAMLILVIGLFVLNGLYHFLVSYNFEVPFISLTVSIVFVFIFFITLLIVYVNIFNYLKKSSSVEF